MKFRLDERKKIYVSLLLLSASIIIIIDSIQRRNDTILCLLNRLFYAIVCNIAHRTTESNANYFVCVC